MDLSFGMLALYIPSIAEYNASKYYFYYVLYRMAKNLIRRKAKISSIDLEDYVLASCSKN